ncbi:MAG: fimbrillin family protein [Candidatus Cryptobacteroides sp.]
MMKPYIYYSAILLLCASAACQKNSKPSDDAVPLAFAADQTKAGLSSIFENFKVWASCDDGSIMTDIMGSYRVNYDSVEGWTYTEGEGTETQELQYWSASASEYCFHAGAPAAKVSSISRNSIVLSMESTTSFSETALYSDACLIKRSDPAYGSVVNLAFNYANSRISLAFKYVSGTVTNLTDIRLNPPASIATSGTYQFDYDWSLPKAVPGALNITANTNAITFPEMAIPENSTAAIETSAPWYMIPDPATKGQWTLSLKINGEEKQTNFTLSKPWEPGKSYLYRFEYTDEAHLVFIGTSTAIFIGENLQPGGEHNFS